MSVETELKFRVTPQKLSSVRKRRVAGLRRGARSERDLISTYFDTNKHKLKRNGLTLRVRRTGSKYVQTVKSAALGNPARGEWEAEVDSAKPDFTKARDSPLADFATKKLSRKLKSVFQTSVHRIAQELSTGLSKIELAVDRGKISAGRRSRPISEFELELKAGSPADLFRIARYFERGTGAELDLRSKSEKGYQLVGGHGKNAQHGQPIKLDNTLSPNDAFRVIGFSTFRHFATNADAVRALDAAGIHQMRVGLRRLRAAISLFDDVLPRSGLSRIKTELKWLTVELAPAREIDVFLKERVQPAIDEDLPKRGSRAIEKKFAAQRMAAFRHAREAIASARFRHMLLDVLEWIEQANRLLAVADRLAHMQLGYLIAGSGRRANKASI
jgi:triphosphatase